MVNKCEYCGIELIKEKLNLWGITKFVLAYPCKCLDDMDLNNIIEKNKKEFVSQVPDLIIDFIKKNPNAKYRKLKEDKSYFLTGKPGNGKTTDAVIVARRKLNKGKKCAFFKVSDVLNYIQDFCLEHKEHEAFSQLKSYSLLILDDLGREKYTEKRLEWFFKLIDNSINVGQQIIVTANPEMLTGLTKIPAFKAIRDRIAGHCETINFENNSFRRY